MRGKPEAFFVHTGKKYRDYEWRKKFFVFFLNPYSPEYIIFYRSGQYVISWSFFLTHLFMIAMRAYAVDFILSAYFVVKIK